MINRFIVTALATIFFAVSMPGFAESKKSDKLELPSAEKIEKKARKAKKERAKKLKKVYINEASAKEITRLPGIGKVKAKAIVDYRKVHGPFTSIDELTKVDGIGKKTALKIAPFIVIE